MIPSTFKWDSNQQIHVWFTQHNSEKVLVILYWQVDRNQIKQGFSTELTHINLFARFVIYLERATMLIFQIKETCLRLEEVMELYDALTFSQLGLIDEY